MMVMMMMMMINVRVSVRKRKREREKHIQSKVKFNKKSQGCTHHNWNIQRMQRTQFQRIGKSRMRTMFARANVEKSSFPHKPNRWRCETKSLVEENCKQFWIILNSGIFIMGKSIKMFTCTNNLLDYVCSVSCIIYPSNKKCVVFSLIFSKLMYRQFG